jgi:hypothetical protein
MSEPTPNVAVTTASAIAANPNDVPKAGMPSWPAPMNLGLVSGTSINQTNNMLVHSCDFVNELQQSILLKDFLKALAKPIREGIRAIKRLLGLGDPTGTFSSIINALSRIAQELRRIQKEVIDPIINFGKFVIAVLVKIRQMIQWILSLPAALLALLGDCLKKLLKAVGKLFSDAWKEAGIGLEATSSNSGDFDALVTQLKDTASAANDTLKAATVAAGVATGIAVSATVGLVTPVSAAEAQNANTVITDYIGTLPDASAELDQPKSAP